MSKIWHGRYNYLELDFNDQQKALKINNPLHDGYIPGASFIKSNDDDLAIYDAENKPDNLKLWR